MTEKEKMLKGELYNPDDPILLHGRAEAKEICYDYNTLRPSETAKQNEMLSGFLGSCGRNFHILPPFRCDYGYNISVGDNFFSNYNLTILDCAPVSFGNNVLIGPNCSFYTASHPIDSKTRNTWLEYAKPIKVGDNVWFGGSVTVLQGVTIGSNAVIGAGSVVVKDIPDHCVAAGNPCKVIRPITEDDAANITR